MQEFGASQVHPELKELVVEASRALALLDADRLEELVNSCLALNRDLSPVETEDLTRQGRDAAADLAVFGRVLEATRANLDVMNRLRQMRADRLDYGETQSRAWVPTEGRHGDN